LALFDPLTIVVRGAGDLASGIIYRLVKSGFRVIATELPDPILVRRTVSYGSAIYEGEITVHDLTSRFVDDLNDLSHSQIPVVIDPDGALITELKPEIIIDARMEKQPLDSTIDLAPLVIAIGPGYIVGQHCHCVIETNRGHDLGRVYWQGQAQPDTGTPGTVKGYTHTRVLRAPSDGHVKALFEIGDYVKQGDTIATINEQQLIAQFDGVLRGIVHPRVRVKEGMKIGDLDPRNDPLACFSISDKSLSIGGGVLEAILSSQVFQEFWVSHRL